MVHHYTAHLEMVRNYKYTIRYSGPSIRASRRRFVKGAALYRFGGVPMDSLLASAALCHLRRARRRRSTHAPALQFSWTGLLPGQIDFIGGSVQDSPWDTLVR